MNLPRALLHHPAPGGGAAPPNAEVTHQAQIIAYANDFKLLLLLRIPTALPVLMTRRIGARGAFRPAHATLD